MHKQEFESQWKRPRSIFFPEIVPDDQILQGSPRLDGTRLAVGDFVSSIYVNQNLSIVQEDYGLSLLEMRQALLYCSTLQCKKDKPNKFCHNCSLRVIQTHGMEAPSGAPAKSDVYVWKLRVRAYGSLVDEFYIGHVVIVR